MTNQKKCPACGKMYTPEKGKSHYACEECTQRILKNIMEVKELPSGVKNKYCVVCGKEITNAHGKQLSCGGEHAKIAAHITDANRYYGNKDISAFRKWSKTFATSKKVDADNARAKAAGLTYGEYMARRAGLV